MDSSPPTSRKGSEPTLPAAGAKRPAPSLLPPFEPLSSSPSLPRPSKRQAVSSAFLKYPTPAPTSSTGILSSSPPRVGLRAARQRPQSVASERAPLSDVPSVELNENGETLLMGRSSSSCHYQLSANRLISRVHVKARYIPATQPLEPNKVEIVCSGWNGLKLHCQGQTWELAKGDSFTSETEGADIMLDVQDARVFVRWPRRDKDRDDLGHLSDSSWDDSPRPRIGGRGTAGSDLHGSPFRRSARIGSPESPTPANVSTSNASLDDLLLGSSNQDDDAPVQIYEDASADEQESPKPSSRPSADASFATQTADSFSSELSDPQSDDENDPDEENDPIIHSFGPFGANISNRLASFSTCSPRKAPEPRNPRTENSDSRSGISAEPPGSSNANSTSTSAKASNSAATPATASGLSEEETANISNHVVNQLAFSRLSSTPLSTIMNNLPAEERNGLSKEQLRIIIESTPCVGIIRRQGKDAAGKPLESEYYYTPELDPDEARRVAVTDGLRKPMLRNCRKQHKVSLLCAPSALPSYTALGGEKVPLGLGLTGFAAILLEAPSHPLATTTRLGSSVSAVYYVHCHDCSSYGKSAEGGRKGACASAWRKGEKKGHIPPLFCLVAGSLRSACPLYLLACWREGCIAQGVDICSCTIAWSLGMLSLSPGLAGTWTCLIMFLLGWPLRLSGSERGAQTGDCPICQSWRLEECCRDSRVASVGLLLLTQDIARLAFPDVTAL